MYKKFTPDELNKMDHETKNDVIYQMQDRLDRLEQNYENLVEQVRLANQQRFGRQTEKLDDIAGQLSFLMRRKRIMMKQLRSQLWKRSLIHPERCRESLRKKVSVKKT